MARPRKVTNEGLAVKVKAPEAVSDGNGGYYPVGVVIQCADEAAKASLIAKGLAE